MTWRQALAATRSVGPAERKRTMQAAYDAGLTFRQIAEGAGLASTSSVYAILGRQGQRASLDDPVER